MFGRIPLNAYPGATMAGLAPVSTNPAGPMFDQPGAVNHASVLPMTARMASAPRLPSPTTATIRVPDPSKFKGQIDPTLMTAGAAPAPAAGMFAANHHSKAANVILALLAGLEGFQAGRGVPGAAEAVGNLQNAMLYRRQQEAADAQTQQNYQALIARGMNPNDALIMAQNPAELAKHLGTHFDQKVLNQGDTLATPDYNGSIQTYTAPDIQRNGADVVQTPGVQGVTPPFSALPVGTPQTIGAPAPIPGLRTDAEQYAASTGAQPGSPEYLRAMQDYTLKAKGPTAFGFDQTLQTQRLGTQRDIAYHHDATSAANNQRSTSTSSANNIRSTGQSNINNLRSTSTSAANAQLTNDTRLQTARHVRALPNEPVATDAHGNKLVVRNGQWVPAH
jgi:hypothetical protein